MLKSHPEIDKLLDDLAKGSANALGDNFTGIYIYGSLAAREFNYQTSDIDFVGVCETELTEQQIASLNSMHMGLLDSNLEWAPKLEGSYFTCAGIRRFDRDHLLQAKWSYGARQLELEEHGPDFDIHRYMLLDKGAALSGPEIETLVDPVSSDQLKLAIRNLLASWWRPMLADSAPLQDLNYRCYAVQTMCRVLYTLKFGDIVAKPAAARWAIGNIDESWLPLIRGSFAWPHSEQEVGLEETLSLITFVTTTALIDK